MNSYDFTIEFNNLMQTVSLLKIGRLYGQNRFENTFYVLVSYKVNVPNEPNLLFFPSETDEPNPFVSNTYLFFIPCL